MTLEKLKSIFGKKKVILTPVYTIHKETREGTVYYHLAKDDIVYCGNKHTSKTAIPLRDWALKKVAPYEEFCQECHEGHTRELLS